MLITQNYLLNSIHSSKPIAVDVFYVANHLPKPIVIFAHGFKGFKDWGHFNVVAQQFAQAGFVFVKFNFSHNGTTPQQPTDFADLEAFGNNNHIIELDDLKTVIDQLSSPTQTWVPATEINTTQIYLIGHSRGGGIAIIKAAEDPRIRKLATWAAVSKLGGWQFDTIDNWRNKGVVYVENARTHQQMPLYYQLCETFNNNQPRLDVQQAVQHLKIPFLIIHGTNDSAVNVKAAHDMHLWNPQSQLLIIENADHVFGAKHPWTLPNLPKDSQLVVDSCIDFFSK
ncbi:MAG: dienelactone hydrolase family protein [Chitinophagales bacterium]|jgi:pimeloyl-ACP methyl ester carboxylesterase|nr:dienelactone hydrolase family protein [Chitinophagales bacterium]